LCEKAWRWIQRNSVTLDWQTTQEMRELDSYERMDSKDWEATIDGKDRKASARHLAES
jgi:hypothetical protein